MKEFIEKLIGRLEECEKAPKLESQYNNGWVTACQVMKNAVNQLAEEYKTTEYINCSTNTSTDLAIIQSLPSLYPLQPFEEEAVHRVVERAKSSNIQTIDVSELLGEQGNDGWIPVSSGRMPEDGVPVEVTVKEDNDNGGYDLYVFESWYQEGRWAISRNRYNPTVIAWKPKDAPYQPKGENNGI